MTPVTCMYMGSRSCFYNTDCMMLIIVQMKFKLF